MSKRRVVMVGFAEAQMLDITGPLEVFSVASRLLGGSGLPGGYEVELVGVEAGVFAASSGIQLVATRSLAECSEGLIGAGAPKPEISGAKRSVEGGLIDTLLVAGGWGVAAALREGRIAAEVARLAPRVRRVGAVCTGAFLLAAAGLLDGRSATTHWASCAELAAMFPQVRVEQDAIFIKSGHVYSSAGVTAGMDLALALVEEDHGRDLALTCARWLVKYLKRAGGQSQFSAVLRAQRAERDPLRDLQHWLADHVDQDLSVQVLAKRVGMSPRNFARAFVKEVGMTPGRYVEGLRVDTAQRKLQDSALSVEEVAATCGFGSAETMRRAFLRRVRVSPAAYRARFA